MYIHIIKLYLYLVLLTNIHTKHNFIVDLWLLILLQFRRQTLASRFYFYAYCYLCTHVGALLVFDQLNTIILCLSHIVTS